MLRTKPPGEDGVGENTRAQPTPFFAEGSPPGEDGIKRAGGEELENAAAQVAAEPFGVDNGEDEEPAIDFLKLVSEAEAQAQLYSAQANKRAWSQSLRAYHNQHHVGSHYTKPEWRGRSSLFIPKTRAAVRKDNAAVAASLFNSIDAINCLPGNEADPKQKASAAIMQELVNYRTDRNSGKAAFPWFLVAVGARQDSVLTGVCISKQCWKQEFRKTGTEIVGDVDEETGEPVLDAETGEPAMIERDIFKLETDRPDMLLIPPENYVIDSAADWTNPAQSSAFLILKWPMQLEEIKAKQKAPVNPWKKLDEAILKGSVDNAKQDVAAIRRARELGLDRMDETTTGTNFQIIWVYETFVRTGGDDYTFFSIGDQHYLTDPAPVREVYPEQFGERPVSLGYANLEAHRIYPMAPAESWQPLQIEANDIRNLMLDATKQNVMPISKVVRGRQVDLDQVRRRSSGSSILVTNKDDVTWEQSPSFPQSSVLMARELSIELDDLAGQQNYGNVEQSNSLGKTLGGLKLAAGAANAVQEFDIRVWIETWAAPALTQIVRLEQYYESDAVVLGLCGNKAQLFEKHGISKIDDDLLEQDITVRVSVGLGAGDPQQRLAKFQSAAAIAAPLLAQSQEFQSGKKRLNTDAIIEEIFGAAGYKDGGARFFIEEENAPVDPMADLKTQELKAKIDKDNNQGKASLMGGIASLAKAAIGKRDLEATVIDNLLGHMAEARNAGVEHAHRRHDQHLAATDHGHRHGMAIAQHRRDGANADREMAAMESEAGEGAGMEGAGPAEPAMAAPSGMASPESSPASSPPSPPSPDVLRQMLQSGEIEFTRDAQGRISGMRMRPRGPQPQPAAPTPMPTPIPAGAR